MWGLLPVPPRSDAGTSEGDLLHGALKSISGAWRASGRSGREDDQGAPWLRVAQVLDAWADAGAGGSAWRPLPVPAKSDCLPALAAPPAPSPLALPHPCRGCCLIEVEDIHNLRVLLWAGCGGPTGGCADSRGTTPTEAAGEPFKSRGAVQRAMLVSRLTYRQQRPVSRRRARPPSPQRKREALPWRLSVRDVQDLAKGTLDLSPPQWTQCASAEDAVARARELRGRLDPGSPSAAPTTSLVLDALFEAWSHGCDPFVPASARPMARQVLALFVLARGVPSVPAEHRGLIVDIARDIARDGPVAPPAPATPAAAAASTEAPRPAPPQGDAASPAAIVVDAPFVAWCARRLGVRSLRCAGAPPVLEAVSPSPVFSATDQRGERLLSVVEGAELGQDEEALAAYVRDLVAAAAAARFALILCACLCGDGCGACPCGEVASRVAGAVAVLPAPAAVLFVHGQDAVAAAIGQACAALGERHGPGLGSGPRRDCAVEDPSLFTEHERFLGHLRFCSPALARVLAGAKPALHLSQKVELAVRYAERVARGHGAGR